MRVIAVPVKALERSKSRLAPHLSPLERGALTLAMLEDVLDVAQAMPGWETWVVSPDEAVLEVAARRHARTVVERAQNSECDRPDPCEEGEQAPAGW